MQSAFPLVFFVFFYEPVCAAATITYSGSDLYNNPNVSFPTTQPTLDSSSLVFGPSATSSINKLLVQPLFSEEQLSETEPTTASVHINLTTLACVTSFGCAGGSILAGC